MYTNLDRCAGRPRRGASGNPGDDAAVGASTWAPPTEPALRGRDSVGLVLLAALWGSSFLLMRVAVPEFGFSVVSSVRVVISAAVLAAVVFASGTGRELSRRRSSLAILGISYAAIPFTLLAFASRSLNAASLSIVNAATPLFAALIGLVWFRRPIAKAQAAGLAVGFLGVAMLGWGEVRVSGSSGAWAVACGLVATASYGFSANYTRHRLAAVRPLVAAAGSQIVAAAVLFPVAILAWPAVPPSPTAWTALVVLGVVSTAAATTLYLALLVRVGPGRATATIFMVPLFASIGGQVFLGEPITLRTVFACAIVLAGTGLCLQTRRPP